MYIYIYTERERYTSGSTKDERGNPSPLGPQYNTPCIIIFIYDIHMYVCDYDISRSIYIYGHSIT